MLKSFGSFDIYQALLAIDFWHSQIQENKIRKFQKRVIQNRQPLFTIISRNILDGIINFMKRFSKIFAVVWVIINQ